jgi:hypothetical protein
MFHHTRDPGICSAGLLLPLSPLGGLVKAKGPAIRASLQPEVPHAKSQ